MTFDLPAYLAEVEPELLQDPEGRRIITRLDPLMFALVYVPKHLRGQETGDEITLSEFHLDLIKQAESWVVPDDEPAESRDAYVAPRGVGKSTWLFLILPLWAAAHGHRKFVAAFADSGAQAEKHLLTFKQELEGNDLLRTDFPELCAPIRRKAGGTVADNRNLYLGKNGFVFSAMGIDSTSLGLKIGNMRPDLLILDDIEPPESNYSNFQKEKRLNTVLEAIFPLNVYARVLIAGTTSMPGSIIHDLVKAARGEDTEKWVADENVNAHHYPAILTDEFTGDERSLWPEKWSMKYLNSIRNTRQFASQMMNNPLARDAPFWNGDDFKYRESMDCTHMILSIDPAVTTREKSDFTAIAVIGYNAVEKVCIVLDAWNLKIQPGEPLRDRVLEIIHRHPQIRGCLIETNQGGDVWKTILHDLPVPVQTVHQKINKEVRAGELLHEYQTGRVYHIRRIPTLEEQMVAFPHGAHDDLVDAVGTGVAVFLKSSRRTRQSRRRRGGTVGYV